MSRLEGKVALGNRGVQGHRRGIAKGLAAAGASVAVNYASPEQRGSCGRGDHRLWRPGNRGSLATFPVQPT